MKKLSPKQQKFCEFYMGQASFNAAEAMRLAGFSPKGAKQNGSKLLAQVEVQVYLAKILHKGEMKAVVSIEKTLNELAAIAHISLDDYLDGDGNLLPPEKMNVAAKRAIRSFKIRRTKDGDEIIDVVLNDKSKALLIVAQHLRMLSNGIEEPEKKQGESIVYVLLADSEADEIRIEQLREGRMEIYMLAQLGGEHDGRIIIPEGVSEVIDVRGGKEITHLIEDAKPWKEDSVDVAQYEVVNETPVDIETRQVRELFEHQEARTTGQSRRKLRRY